MKPHVSLEQDSLRRETCVLIDSTTTLGFASHLFFNQNCLFGKSIRGQKIVVHNALE
jgi:hypothetical protein